MLFFGSMIVQLDPKTISPINGEARKKLDLRAGDTVRVHQKIVETKHGTAANKKETTTKNVRTQVFEGLVIAKKHGTEAGATFTVRATLSGIGVEKIFPLYSPMIERIEIMRRSKVRRAKLYYIRDKVAREMRRQLRKIIAVSASTNISDDTDAVGEEDAAASEAVAETEAKS